MSGPHRGAWPVDRRLVLALVPVLVGVVILATRGDRSPVATSRLAATGTTAPLLRAAGLPPVPPALPALDDGPATATATAGLGDGPDAVGATTTTDDRSTPGGAAGPAQGDSAAAGPATNKASPTAPGTTLPATTVAGATPASDTTAAPTPRAANPQVTTTESPTTEAPTTTTTAAPPATTTTTAAPAAAAAGRLPDVEAAVVPLTNQDRAGAGLGALSRNSCLDSIASGYAQQMARNGVLAHNPGAASAIAGCRPAPTWGDNIGTATPCSASLLEQRWMASPTHRENIMTPAFQYIGVGAWTDDAGACWVQVLFSS